MSIEKILDISLPFPFITSLILFGLEGKHLENTMGGFRLGLISFISGVAIGCFITHLMFKSRCCRGFDAITKLFFSIAIIVTAALFGVTSASWINRSFGAPIDYSVAYTVVDRAVIPSRKRKAPSGGYLYLKVNTKEERIKVSYDFWQRASEGTPIVLTLRRGLLGYPFIIKYEQG